MELVNVYDFDHTIYQGDSTLDFYFYCLKRFPVILMDIPKQLAGAWNYRRGKCSKTQFKESFFCYLKRINEIDSVVESFWKEKISHIEPWYQSQKTSDDIIISASPEFLLSVVCNRLGVRLIASKVDEMTGKFTGENCYGQEKVRRLQMEFPQIQVNQFYSDSRSDEPLAKLARESFLVKGGKINSWKK